MKLRLNIQRLPIRLDDHTTFHHAPKNGINDSIVVTIDEVRERQKGRTKKENTKKKEVKIYRKQDLVRYYEVDRGDLKLDETKEFIIHEKKELIFIPLCNIDHNIVAYAIISLSDYDKVKGKVFNRRISGNKVYVRNTNGGKNLHEIIFGRPAKAGGWEKIDNYLETEESLSTVWIKSQGMPAPHIGKNWNYCRDENGNVYIKMPGYTIDHRNSDGLDNRRTNLREAIFSLNSANKTKRQGCTSKYFGVFKSGDKWVSSIKFNGVGYYRRFDSEEHAATFHDIYSLVLYKEIICNNGMLSEIQAKDILERGEAAVPPEFLVSRKQERELPKYIVMDKGKFKVVKHFMRREYAMRFDTLEEAIAALPELHATIQKVKDEYRNFIEKINSHNLYEKEGYGILEANDKFGQIRCKAIVDSEIWKKFIHINWTISGNNRLIGIINGVINEVHVHAYRECYPDYHKSTHGTVDHKNGDKNGVSDCRIKNLRPASFSQQGQNREIRGKFPYRGIGISEDKFFAVLGWNRKMIYGKRRKYIEDAARDYNFMVLEKWKDATLNVVPDTKTPVEFFYHKSKLNLEQIENFSTRELMAVLYINTDWAEACGIKQVRSITRILLEKYKNMVIKLFKGEEVVDDFDADESDNDDLENLDHKLEDGLEILDDEYLHDEDEEYDEEDELDEIDTKIPENEPYKRKQYIDMPMDPETDASEKGNWVYGYEKRFDRSKVVIKEDEAEIIRIIFREIGNKRTRKQVVKILNDAGYRKKGVLWTTPMVDRIYYRKDVYEGKLVKGGPDDIGFADGRLFRHPKIL